MLWASAHSFSCNCFKFSPISQAVVLGLNFNGFPLWHLKGVHRGGNSSLLLLTYHNFPFKRWSIKYISKTPDEAKIVGDKNAPVVDLVIPKTSMSSKSIWIYLKSQIEFWNLRILSEYLFQTWTFLSGAISVYSTFSHDRRLLHHSEGSMFEINFQTEFSNFKSQFKI
jgi:hypothetical protein